MAQKLNSWQKATALVPLALLSGAWTTTLAATSATTAEVSRDGQSVTLPDGTTVPNAAIESPASVSQPGSIAADVPADASAAVISSASTNGIPAAALEAYQRAAQVINSADPSCKAPWELLAAIGRVESDHGRYGGNTINGEGKSTPGIYGIPLDGSNGTAKITDTDGGQYDNDQIYDRAVGPMQFIPSTWSVVGVDGDGDDVRDPQDIDDAALASAVYLCSGEENLSATGGQRAAVYRYNHSQAYVDLVLSIMNSYMGGDFAAVPNGVAAPTVFAPMPQDSVVTPATSGKKAKARNNGGDRGTNTGGSTGTGANTGSTDDSGDTGTPSGNTNDNDGPVVPNPPETDKPADDRDPVRDTVDRVGDTVDRATGGGGNTGGGAGGSDPVEETMTRAEASARCLAQNPLLTGDALETCISRLISG